MRRWKNRCLYLIIGEQISDTGKKVQDHTEWVQENRSGRKEEIHWLTSAHKSRGKLGWKCSQTIQPDTIKSKWNGDTGKMVNAIFENALENQPCILLFDECDGLFGSHALDDNSSSNDLKNALKTCLCNNDNAGAKCYPKNNVLMW